MLAESKITLCGEANPDIPALSLRCMNTKTGFLKPAGWRVGEWASGIELRYPQEVQVPQGELRLVPFWGRGFNSVGS